MAITLSKYPILVSLVKNPIVFKLLTNNSVSTAGVKEVFALTFSAGLAAADSFDLLWGDNIVSIVADATPDTSGNQIKSIGAETLALWIEQTVSYLNANYLLNKYYVITYTATKIIFTARVSGTAYIMTLDNEPGAKMSGAETATGLDEVAREFFGIILHTYVKSGAVMVNALEDLLAIDSSNYGMVNVAEIVKTYFEGYSDFEFPETDANAMIKRSNICIPYYLRYAEQYGNPPVVQGLQSTTTFYALNGGIPFWKQQWFYQTYTSFWKYLQDTIKYLTWHPKTKYIDITSTEKLYWLAWDSYLRTTSVTLKVTITSATGTITEVTTLLQDMTYLEVYELEVSYARLNTLISLGTHLSGTPGDFYEVELINPTIGGPQHYLLGEKRKYIIDYNEYPYKRYFLYHTSLGGYDTLRATGIGKTKYTQDRIVAKKTYLKEYAAAFNINREIFIEGSQKITCNSGWILSLDELDAWLDMLYSDEVYEIISGKLYPVNFTISDTPEYSDEHVPDPAYNFNFEYERSTAETTYIIGTGYTPPQIEPIDPTGIIE